MMGDIPFGDDETGQPIPNGQQFVKEFDDFAEKYEQITNKFATTVGKFEAASLTKSNQFKKIADQAQRSAGSIIKSYRAASKETKKINYLDENTKTQTLEFFKQLSKFAERSGGDLQKVLGGGAIYGAARALDTTVKKLDRLSGGIFSAEKKIKSFERSSIQANVSMGQTFSVATNSADSFRKKYFDLMHQMNATPEQLASVKKGFSGMLDTEDIAVGLDNLGVASSTLGTSLNAMSASLATAAATGMEEQKVSEWIAKSYRELNADLTESVGALGDIQWATKDSELSFEKVGTSIMGAATELKFFGGNVKGVVPIWKDFSKYLGDNEKGLAPELFNKYMSGIKSMSLEARALTGMQMPGVRGAGAIGAGLRMEQALEQGPGGMQKVSKSITETLKKFGGGKIITREQAIENPALERNFMVQRGLLKQLIGVSDPAMANKTLGILKQMEAGGGRTYDAQKQLSNLLKSGKTVQEQTVSTLDKAATRVETAIQRSAADIIKGVSGAMASTELNKQASTIAKIFNDAVGTGKVNIKSIVKTLVGSIVQDKKQKPVVTRPEQAIDTAKELKNRVDAASKGSGKATDSVFKTGGIPKKARDNFAATVEKRLGPAEPKKTDAKDVQTKTVSVPSLLENFQESVKNELWLSRQQRPVLQPSNLREPEFKNLPGPAPSPVSNAPTSTEPQKKTIELEVAFTAPKIETSGAKIIIDLEQQIKDMIAEGVKKIVFGVE